jgi:RNA polymerase sigma factor (sigma-70 family)
VAQPAIGDADLFLGALLSLARRMASRWCDSSADADDVAQEALIQYISQTSPPRNSPAWLYVVIRRLCHRRSLRERTRARAEETYVFDQRSNPAGIELLIDVATVLERMAPRDRSLLLHVMEGALSSEIALEFDCHIHNVGQMVARARRKSRALLIDRDARKK